MSRPPEGWIIHLKLNEIVAALEGASNRLINVEDLTEEEVRVLHLHYQRLVSIAKAEGSLTRSHSIEEAAARYRRKKRRERALAESSAAPVAAVGSSPPAAVAPEEPMDPAGSAR